VIGTMLIPPHIASVMPAYEAAMVREAQAVCAAIPHQDLCVQWDVCIEMISLDARTPFIPAFPGMEKVFGERFARLAAAVPSDVEMGYHLCYGDLDAKHTIEPQDAGKLVEMTHLIASSVKRPIAYVHMPVPIDRSDDAYFAPLKDLKLPSGTELYLGLVHHGDGVDGTRKRMAAAAKFAPAFGIASECGISRARTSQRVTEILKVHAAAAG
jgi:methionine synthase II (cobalamin-independent)